MYKVRPVFRTAIIGTVGALTLSIAACGADSGSSTPAASSTRAASSASDGDCRLALGAGTEISTRLSAYNSKRDPKDLIVIDSTMSLHQRTAALIKDPALRELGDQTMASLTAWNTAAASGDTTELKRLIGAQKIVMTSMLDSCRDVLDTETFSTFASFLDFLERGLAAPSTTTSVTPKPTPKPTPVALTPAATFLKVGQPAFLEFADDEKKGTFSFTITAIDKAPDADLKTFDKDSLKGVNYMFYVRAEVQQVNPEASSSPESLIRAMTPAYTMVTSDHNRSGEITAFRTFKPCADDIGSASEPTGRSTLCAMIGVLSESGAQPTVTEVQLNSLTSSLKTGEPPLAIWNP
ncbi:hypothetical protein [Rhodococcus sp. ARC_M6]|uniref:hypothetical protein n=1 Tax=Rhodococcus sp. ARC_M6 TaxID=2928852 RepID=UPI001FB46506|nr:hypothetical protein [Rhodococcus sp. ARC_M6]MCJ0907117.1 hypothetical protein [Rhodococcus sp. ARC_M6]